MAKLYSTISNTIARSVKTPKYIILFLNDKCWMNCSHCWYNKEWKKNNLTEENLTYDQLEKMSHSIKSIEFLTMTGGEAILREDIVEIANMFVKNSGVKRYDIPTSGYDTDLIVNRTEQILRNNPNIPFRISVSLDGIGEVHDTIRNKTGAFNNACETIIQLDKLKQKYSNFNAGIITTISDKNQFQIDEIAEYLTHKLPICEWMINATRDTPSDSEAKRFSVQSYKKALENYSNYLNSANYAKYNESNPQIKLLVAKNKLRSKIIIDILEGNGKWCLCSAGNLIGVIFNDGAVRPCETLDLEFGNLHDYNYNLIELWNSKQADDVRRKIIESKCYCTHECFLSLSILMNPKFIIKLCKERLAL